MCYIVSRAVRWWIERPQFIILLTIKIQAMSIDETINQNMFGKNYGLIETMLRSADELKLSRKNIRSVIQFIPRTWITYQLIALLGITLKTLHNLFITVYIFDDIKITIRNSSTVFRKSGTMLWRNPNSSSVWVQRTGQRANQILNIQIICRVDDTRPSHEHITCVFFVSPY